MPHEKGAGAPRISADARQNQDKTYKTFESQCTRPETDPQNFAARPAAPRWPAHRRHTNQRRRHTNTRRRSRIRADPSQNHRNPRSTIERHARVIRNRTDQIRPHAPSGVRRPAQRHHQAPTPSRTCADTRDYEPTLHQTTEKQGEPQNTHACDPKFTNHILRHVPSMVFAGFGSFLWFWFASALIRVLSAHFRVGSPHIAWRAGGASGMRACGVACIRGGGVVVALLWFSLVLYVCSCF
jgi:hypothetical protein